MTMLPFSATTGVSASGLFADALSRTLQIWSEELKRASAAVRRYEELRNGQATDPLPRDRASKARQVFVDMYDGR